MKWLHWHDLTFLMNPRMFLSQWLCWKHVMMLRREPSPLIMRSCGTSLIKSLRIKCKKKTSLLLNFSNRKGCYREVPLAFNFINRVFKWRCSVVMGFFRMKWKYYLNYTWGPFEAKSKSQGFCLPFSIYHFSRWREGVFINNNVIFMNKELLKLVGKSLTRYVKTSSWHR